MRPYVVSCDLARLWDRAGFLVPKQVLQDFRSEVNIALQACIGESQWVCEQEMIDGMTRLMTTSSVPVISLDPVYAPLSRSLSLTRLIDPSLQEAGYGSRDGLSLQLDQKVGTLCRQLSTNEIALADDVLFSGGLVSHLIDLFARHDVHVRHLYVGIAIGMGIDRLSSHGCEVKAVRIYPDVIDEICERDFLPGAPMSGRTVIGMPNTGAPYMLPFGLPVEWASIPPNAQRAFSRDVLLASAKFYEAMQMRAKDLPRTILGQPMDPDCLVHEHLMAIAKDL